MGEKLDRIKNTVRERIGSCASVEVFGNGEALISGCTSLIDFNDSRVDADTVSGRVTVFGDKLEVCAFRADILSLRGKIEKIEFGDCVCS